MTKRRASSTFAAIAALTLAFTTTAYGSVSLVDVDGVGYMLVTDDSGQGTYFSTYGNVLGTSYPIASLPTRCASAGTTTVNGVLVYLTQCTGALVWDIDALDQLDVIHVFSPSMVLDVSGGSGIDIIRLDSAGDAEGGSENDAIFGSSSADNLEGNAGNDEIEGGGGADQILGDTGDDDLFGDGGADTIQGNAGNDEITGGSGMDTLNGGENADIIHAIDGEQDSVNCGSDSGAVDTVHIDCGLDTTTNCGSDTVLCTP